MNKIYTVGYQSFKKIEKMGELVREKQANLVDIRYRPWSKDEQWQADSIQKAFLAAGLSGRYWWVRDMGNINYNSSEPIKLWNPAEGIHRIKEFAEHRPVILMCGCWDYEHCHRKVVAELLTEKLGVVIQEFKVPKKEEEAQIKTDLQLTMF